MQTTSIPETDIYVYNVTNYLDRQIILSSQKEILQLNLDNINQKSHKLMHGDLCTFDKKTKMLRKTLHNKYSIQTGIVEINKLRSYGKNRKNFPYYKFRPYDKKYPPCTVALNKFVQNPMHGSRYFIAVQYIEWFGTLPKGELIKLFGSCADYEAEEKMVLYRFNVQFRRHLPDKLKKICANSTIYDFFEPTEILAQRHLFNQKLNIFSIDPSGCADIDDAVHCHFGLNKRDFTTFVHIADVATWVQKFNMTVKEWQTVYTNKKPVYMFHPSCSTHMFSLKSNTTRLAITIEINWELLHNNTYVVRSSKIYKSLVQVGFNLDYHFVDDELKKNNSKHPCAEQIKNLFFVLQNAATKDSLEVIDSHTMIAKLMVTSNFLFARQLLRHCSHGILRTHPETAEKLEFIDEIFNQDVADFLKIYFCKAGSYVVYDKIFNEKTELSHYGLSLPYYAHCTSPIRRWVDVLNQIYLFDDRPDTKYLYSEPNVNEHTKRHKKIQKELLELKEKHKTRNQVCETETGYVINTDPLHISLYFPNRKFLFHYGHLPNKKLKFLQTVKGKFCVLQDSRFKFSFQEFL